MDVDIINKASALVDEFVQRQGEDASQHEENIRYHFKVAINPALADRASGVIVLPPTKADLIDAIQGARVGAKTFAEENYKKDGMSSHHRKADALHDELIASLT